MSKKPENDTAQGKGTALPSALFGSEGLFTEFLKAIDPSAWYEQNVRFTKEMFRIMTGSSEIQPDPRDWRFKDGAWQNNPFYKRLAQSYLAMTDAIEGMIPEDLEPDKKARVELATEIVTTAFAPTNTLVGNPAALLKSIETQGQSTAKGFRNFLDDWLNNDGMPSQVDASKFEVGKNLALTPGKVVHKTEMFELIHYAPVEKEVYEIPTLLIPPQINRFYFTDLAPGRSFAEYTVGRGLNHFVVSWRNPQAEHSDWSLEDYAEAALEAVKTVADISGAGKVNLIAFCAGGILASLVSGYLAAKKRDLINTLALCVTMLDWKSDATIGAFRFPTMLSVARAQAEMKGVLAGEDLSKVFTWLRPNDLVWNYWVNNYLMGETPAAFDILAWNNDSTNLPKQLHADFLKIFENNPLVTPGEYEFLGEKIDLGKIACDNYIVGAVTDHLTPWKACYRSCHLLGGTSTFALSNGGHVAALVNPPSNPKAHHFEAPGTPPDADAWEPTAERKTGSWWVGWADWVSERSGEMVAAPKKLGSKKFAASANAPGEYVLM
ncbi:MAG: alpha/beta fold hydrolase [Sphingomonadaceae bacterium]